MITTFVLPPIMLLLPLVVVLVPVMVAAALVSVNGDEAFKVL
jgi:hypothetical protein